MTYVRRACCAVLLLLAVTWTASAQDLTPLAATVTVTADGVQVVRANTTRPLPLRAGAIAPLGAGDQVLTDADGRALVRFGEDSTLLLLPDSRYTVLVYGAGEGGEQVLDAALSGIAIQRVASPAQWQYQLQTDGLTVTQPSALFAVWALPDRFEGVVSASGDVTMTPTEAAPIEVLAGQGWLLGYDAPPTPLQAPYLHPVPVLIDALACVGTVSTGGSDGLRLRRGAALDYPIVGVLRDGQQVGIAGVTENGLWYRIQYQTGFGWLFSDLVTTDDPDCARLPVSPNLIGESNETVGRLTEDERGLVEPFYGTPRQNGVFYR